MPGTVVKARSAAEIEAARGLVWEFFDVMRERYPEMVEMIDAYIEEREIAKELENFADVFLPPNGECFLALQDGRPVGTVMLKPLGESDGELNRMYVRESARGLGLGRKLGEALVQEARGLGYRALRLDALHRHVEALPLYESLGFERYDDPQAFGGDDERFVRMRLRL